MFPSRIFLLYLKYLSNTDFVYMFYELPTRWWIKSWSVLHPMQKDISLIDESLFSPLKIVSKEGVSFGFYACASRFFFCFFLWDLKLFINFGGRLKMGQLVETHVRDSDETSSEGCACVFRSSCLRFTLRYVRGIINSRNKKSLNNNNTKQNGCNCSKKKRPMWVI